MGLVFRHDRAEYFGSVQSVRGLGPLRWDSDDVVEGPCHMRAIQTWT